MAARSLLLLGMFLLDTVAKCQLSGTAAQIVEPPHDQTVPVNSVARFTCTTVDVVVWEINVDSVVNTRLSQGDTGADVYFLQQQGIRVDSDNKSILLVNATLENNGTNIRCLTGLDAIRLTVISNTAMLMVFDRPDPPSDLTLLPVEPFTLSWSPPFTPFASPGVTLSYFVNVTNLNTSGVTSSGELNTASFNFSGTEDGSPCDVYQFTVTARNAAGWSKPSDTFTASLPSLPDNVSDVNHSVMISGEDALVKVTFQPASACTGYPVTQYNLNIGSSDLNLTAMMLGPYTSNGASRVEIALNSSDGIHQNTHYHFQILAVNIIGSSISRGMEFYTSDVQLAEVQYDNIQSVAVTCHFAEGSQALGCYVQLSFSNDYQALNISRNKTSYIADQLIKTHFPSHCYLSQLYVYDWEADGTVGTLPIPVETLFSEGASGTCRTVTGTAATKPTNQDITQTTLGVGAAVGIAVTVTGTITFVIGFLAGVLLFYCISKQRSQSPRLESFSQQQQQTVPEYEEVPTTSPEERIELRENIVYESVQH